MRRQEQAAKDQADSGSPNEETGKILALNLFLLDPRIMRFIIEEFNIKCNPSKLFITQKQLNKKINPFSLFLHAA